MYSLFTCTPLPVYTDSDSDSGFFMAVKSYREKERKEKRNPGPISIAFFFTAQVNYIHPDCDSCLNQYNIQLLQYYDATRKCSQALGAANQHPTASNITWIESPSTSSRSNGVSSGLGLISPIKNLKAEISTPRCAP